MLNMEGWSGKVRRKLGFRKPKVHGGIGQLEKKPSTNPTKKREPPKKKTIDKKRRG